MLVLFQSAIHKFLLHINKSLTINKLVKKKKYLLKFKIFFFIYCKFKFVNFFFL